MSEPARNLQHDSVAEDLSDLQNAEMASTPIVEEYATGWQRLFAFLLDGVFAGIIKSVACAVFTAVTHAQAKSGAVVLLGAGVSLFYFVFMQYNNGQTLGKKIMKIRLESETAPDASFGQVLGRETVGRFCSSVLFCIGYLGAWRDAEHKTWHDKMFKTKVVKAT